MMTVLVAVRSASRSSLTAYPKQRAPQLSVPVGSCIDRAGHTADNLHTKTSRFLRRGLRTFQFTFPLGVPDEQ